MEKKRRRFQLAAGVLAALCCLLAAGLIWAPFSAPQGNPMAFTAAKVRRVVVKNQLSGAWTELDLIKLGDLLDGLKCIELRGEEETDPPGVPWLELTLYGESGTQLHTLALAGGGGMWLDGQPCRNEGEPLDAYALSRLTERYGKYRLADVEPQQVAGAELSNGRTGQSAALRDGEPIRQLVENLSAVVWEKGEPEPMGLSGSYLGISLSLKEGRGEVFLEVLSPVLAAFQDCYYHAVDGQVDTAALEELVKQYEN